MAKINSMVGQFRSVAEFSHAFSQNGWPTDCRQLDCGFGGAGLQVVMSENAIVQHVAFAPRTQQFFCTPAGYQSYGLPSGMVAFANIKTQHGRPNGLLLRMEEEEGVEAISAPDFSAITLSFSKQRHSELAENLGLPDPGDVTDGRGLELFDQSAQTSVLIHSVRQLFESSDTNYSGTLRQSDNLRNMESELPTQLLLATSNPLSKQRATLRNRERVLNRALEYIVSHPHEALTVEELCVASATSMSTLERAFLERYNMTPKRYILVQRLHHVHNSLLSQGGKRRQGIAEIANDWGFWHMGKFASDYKRLFGYLPSQTPL